VATGRRLAAIVFTDIEGYTTLSHRDEPAALALVKDHEALLDPLLSTLHGRKVKSTGDGFLIEFESAREATQCGIELQEHVHDRNARPGVVPLRIRVGVHLGDVERVGSDILGDAVNIASRVESVAEPGGVCVSGPVYEQVHNKVAYRFQKLDARPLKGVQSTIEIYRAVLPWLEHPLPKSPELLARIAVLPFTNISPDPNDEFFADGLTEELITIVAQLPELLVIARTSVLPYKTGPKSIAQIGSELGVNWVVEGSVRKVGEQLRITVQLIDVASQGHRWAETYDRKLHDVFAVQSEVARRIAEELKLKLSQPDRQRLDRVPQVKSESYLAYLRGLALFGAEWAEANFKNARAQFERALELDEGNARAHAGLADVIRYLHYGRYDDSGGDWDRLSRVHAARALDLDPTVSEAHVTLASIAWDNFEYSDAEKEFRLALSLNPSNAQAHHWYAALLLDERRMDEALGELALSQELDPQSLQKANWYFTTLLMARRLKEAKSQLDRIASLSDQGAQYHWGLAALHVIEGNIPAALQAAARVEEFGRSRDWFELSWLYAQCGRLDKVRELLGEAAKGPLVGGIVTELAVTYGMLGDLDRCFELMDLAAKNKDVALQVFRNEPTLEPLRRDPRFGRLLERMNLA